MGGAWMKEGDVGSEQTWTNMHRHTLGQWEFLSYLVSIDDDDDDEYSSISAELGARDCFFMHEPDSPNSVDLPAHCRCGVVGLD
jgi:hypothetical protein